jgi:nucleotide-binding universal stress UspA family protein
MIKTILVPTSGSSTDDSVFASALAVARPLAAHIEFYHLRVTPGEAAPRAPHVDFCMGPALNDALQHLSDEEMSLSAAARLNVERFCESNDLAFCNVPDKSAAVSASWCEEIDHAADRLLYHARHSDLVVLGRPHHVDFMPPSLIEDLLISCGRPVLIAPESAPRKITGTIVIGWKETPEAARALAAALPLLEVAHRVILVGVAEESYTVPQTLEHLIKQLAWHGIAAESRVITGKASAATQLPIAAVDLHADLLVVGGFGHGPLRELVFGGVTRSLLEHAEVPVFMLH